MSSEVQTMANLDDAPTPTALRTPLYLIVAVFGAVMVLATFLNWGTVESPEDSSIDATVSGLDAGGWGLGALIVGVLIVALGILGYVWNPFSDPEAAFIAAFSGAALVAALIKIFDVESLFGEGEPLFEFFDADSSAGIGLWLVAVAALLALLSALWILFSRPRAESRLGI